MKVRIFDTTLRDGEQSPGVALSPENKLNIAKKLDELGVDAIETGFPVISEGEQNAVKMITKANLSAELCGLARTNQRDIDAVVDCGLKYVHTFIATSDIHLQHKLHLSQDQALEKAVESVEYAKSRGLQVEFSAEDATRTDRDFLKKIFTAVTKAGADRIDIPDTVGYSTPQYIAEITKDAIEATKLPISMHCHNDFGLAVANAISGIQAGAQCAHVTVNGIGERAGNASLEELVMALQCLRFDQSWETNIKTELLYETSKYVSKLAGMPVQPNNKHAGAHGISAMLGEYGVEPDKDQLKQILEKVKSIGDQGKHVTDVELLSMANEVMGDSKLKRLVQLTGFSVSTGMGNMPYAFVKLNIDGDEHTATDYGVGPVDASLNAIQKITGKISEIRIKDYNLASISGGSTALCEVTVKLEDAMQNSVSSKSVGEDIVITSVQAVIDGMNRLLLKKILKQKKA